jgi:hypothetical protein
MIMSLGFLSGIEINIDRVPDFAGMTCDPRFTPATAAILGTGVRMGAVKAVAAVARRALGRGAPGAVGPPASL